MKKSSRSIEGKDFPNFDMLDARIASALNKIIENSQFKKKVSLEEQKALREDRFLRGRQITHMMIMRNSSLSVFETMMFRTSIQNGTKFYSL